MLEMADCDELEHRATDVQEDDDDRLGSDRRVGTIVVKREPSIVQHQLQETFVLSLT